MVLRRWLWASLLTGLLFAVDPALAEAPRSYINSVELARGDGGALLLNFRVHQSAGRQVLETLESGLPVRFTYWIRVEHPRKFLPDQSLVDLRFERVLEKDNLKDRYVLRMEGGEPPRNVTSVAEALRTMTRVRDVRLVPLSVLEDQHPLYLRIKARLQRFELPFRLHYVLPFVSYWDTDTEWYSLELPARVEAVR